MDPYAPVHFLFAALCHLAPSVDGNDGEVSQCTAHVSRPSLFLSIRRYRQSRPGFCSDFSSRRKIGPPSSSLFLSLSLSLSLCICLSLFFFITRRMRTFRTVGVRRTTPKKTKQNKRSARVVKKTRCVGLENYEAFVDASTKIAKKPTKSGSSFFFFFYNYGL